MDLAIRGPLFLKEIRIAVAHGLDGQADGLGQTGVDGIDRDGADRAATRTLKWSSSTARKPSFSEFSMS